VPDYPPPHGVCWTYLSPRQAGEAVQRMEGAGWIELAVIDVAPAAI
jgi:hypothetical protein